MKLARLTNILRVFALMAICLAGNANADQYSCSTTPFQLKFALTSTDTAAAAGTELGHKYDHVQFCNATLMPGKVDITETAIGPSAGQDGYRLIAPGLSLRVEIFRRTSHYSSLGQETAFTKNSGNLGGGNVWPDAPWPSSGKGPYSFKLRYTANYYLRREAGPLTPGTHVVPIGQHTTPTGIETLSVSIHIPNPTCSVVVAHQRVPLASVVSTSLNMLNIGQAMNPGTKFSIKLKCTEANKVNLTLLDNHASGVQNYFPLDPNATAKGVALALERIAPTEPVRPGQPIAIPLSGTDTMLSPEFIVKYIKIHDVVTPGEVRGSATITLKYE
jgi:type 1 fimbria pilin